MTIHRNRYIKITLFEPSSTNLMGGTIVGQFGDSLLVERPQPKERAKPAVPRKPRATTAKAAATAATATTAVAKKSATIAAAPTPPHTPTDTVEAGS